MNIIILGGGSEIGQAIAKRAKSAGNARILSVSRSVKLQSARPSKTFRELTGIDLTKRSDLLKLRRAASAFFSTPFAVIHSVGEFWVHKPLVCTSFAEIKRMSDSHYLTLAGAAWSLLPLMVQRKGGRFIAFSCNSVGYNYPDMAPFTSAKSAVETFVKCIAHEYAPFGVLANAFALPTIDTMRVRQEKPEGDHGNFITPEDLASTVISSIVELPAQMNGSVVKLFKPSETFYSSSYFARNPRRGSIARCAEIAPVR